ncbi:glycoside hydrolase family 16 protein [Mycena crocata]|nr:glycoside hydrolase family 16 protein [Mycena crocata]
MFRVALVLFSVAFAEANSSGTAQSRTFRSRRSAASHPSIPQKNWTRTDHWQGEDFLDGSWDFFFDRPDPTHGLVNYQSKEDAQSKKLAFSDGNNLILAVDNMTTLSHGAKRDSVRISSKKTYNAGSLFIADFASMPSSCGVWPAWWSVGPGWPNGGEIDILEGVHEVNTNKMTLHTGPNCVVDRTTHMTGQAHLTDCTSANGANQGCGVLDSNQNSYGAGFNKAGGGVYAHLWTNDAIWVWHFARGDIPPDVVAEEPNPAGWPLPTGMFIAGGCDFATHFRDHVLTIDTTIGGDWAGSPSSLKAAHCPTDASEIVKDPKNFDSARWNISSIAVYS